MDFERKPSPNSFYDCSRLLKEEAQKCGITVIDGEYLTPRISDFYTDGLHPNDLGFTIYGMNLASEIQKHCN